MTYGDLGRWMRWVLTAHAQRYHRHHKTSGHVWQGRFNAFPVQDVDHLATVLRYVERNALRAQLVTRAEHSRWSSLPGWLAGDPLHWRGEPPPRGADWLVRVNAPLSAGDLQRLRTSVARESPFGTEAWARWTAEQLGLGPTLRPRGHPKKYESPPFPVPSLVGNCGCNQASGSCAASVCAPVWLSSTRGILLVANAPTRTGVGTMWSQRPRQSPSNVTSLSGLWVGCYYQHSLPHPIEADMTQDGERLTGVMRDCETDKTSTVFDVAADAGLPPGADEQIEAVLRAKFPEAHAAPIRYVTHLPAESLLEGSVSGLKVGFLKSYQGEHFGGYAVGDHFVGHRTQSHAVHYRGDLSPEGQEITGKWWIDANPEVGMPRTEGAFTLRRQTGG